MGCSDRGLRLWIGANAGHNRDDRRDRDRLVLGALFASVVVSVVLAAAGCSTTTSSSAGSAGSASSSLVPRTSPTRKAPPDTAGLPASAAGVVVGAAPFGGDALIVTQSTIDPGMVGSDQPFVTDSARMRRVSSDGSLHDVDIAPANGVVSTGTATWTLNAACATQPQPDHGSAALVEIDPATVTAGQRIELSLPCQPSSPATLAADQYAIYVAINSSIERVDLITGSHTHFFAPGPVAAMVRTPTSLWVSVISTADRSGLFRLEPTSGAVLGSVNLVAQRLASGDGGLWAIEHSCAGPPASGAVPCAAPGRLVRVDDNTSVSPGPTVVAPSRGENTTQGAVLLTASDRDLWVLTRQDWTSPSEDQRSRATAPRVTTTMRVERRDRRTGDILSVHELGTRAPEDKPLPGFPPRRPDQLILLDSGRVLLATSASGTFEISPIDP